MRLLSLANSLLLLVFAGSLAAARHASAQHIGPVTEIVTIGETIYSCSQAGIFAEMKTANGKEGGSELIFNPPFRVASIAAFPGSKRTPGYLMVGGGEPGEYGMIGVYDLKAGEFTHLDVAKDVVYSVAVSPSGELGAAACAGNRVITVSLPSLKAAPVAVRHRHTGAARAVCFSPDGKWIASAGLDGAVLLSAATGKGGGEPAVLQGHSAKVDALAFSPDGKQIASGARDGSVRVHGVDGRLVRTYHRLVSEPDANSSVLALAWGGTPERIVAGTAHGWLFQLSVTDNQYERMDWESEGGHPVYSLAFAGDPPRIVVGTNVVMIVDFGSPVNGT